MTENIRVRNDNFRELRVRLRNNPRQSWLELENVLTNVQDRRAFIFLMDAYNTEKEITREIIEQMLENTISINSDLIEIIDNNKNKTLSEYLNEVFSTKNIKSLIIASIVIGLIIGIATNETVALKVVETFTEQQGEKK